MHPAIQQYTPQIKEMAAHAKEIGFDIVNGDIMDLMRSWYNSNRNIYEAIEADTKATTSLLKRIINNKSTY